MAITTILIAATFARSKCYIVNHEKGRRWKGTDADDAAARDAAKRTAYLGHIASQKLMENAKKDVKDSHTLICSAL